MAQVWGAIWIGGRSNLVFLKDSLHKESFKTEDYIEKCLKKEVKPYIKRGKYTFSFLPLFIIIN
jgi:hypothetical protein